MSTTDPIAELRRLGQSVWLDQMDRTMIRSGALARYRDRGVTGVTANPTIFARALESADAAYADDVERRLARGQDAESIVWDLLVEDVQAAADVMRPVYDRERGGDGFVSIEVSRLCPARPRSPTPSSPTSSSRSSTPARAGTRCANREPLYSAACGRARRRRTPATAT